MLHKIKIDKVLTPKNRLYITKNIDDRLIHGVLESAGIKMSRTNRPVYSVIEDIHIKIDLSIPKAGE